MDDSTKCTYFVPTACHDAVDLFISQLWAVETHATGNLIHYFRVV